MPLRTLVASTLVLACAASASAASLYLESPATRVSLLELYTSEGCSSCPPADRWLSDLKRDPRLWQQLVPVAFHVDYWDYIGWNDRFASSVYSDRQRQYARSKNVSTVYTPGFVVAGKEWRGWFRRPKLTLDDDDPVGTLSIRVDQGAARVAFAPVHEIRGQMEIHVAILGFDLKTKVQAGENGGRTLAHDFVVLGYSRIAATSQGGGYAADLPLPSARVDAQRTAVAAWISRADDPSPIQAVGGWSAD
jgi:hypothetical protein